MIGVAVVLVETRLPLPPLQPIDANIEISSTTEISTLRISYLFRSTGGAYPA